MEERWSQADPAATSQVSTSSRPQVVSCRSHGDDSADLAKQLKQMEGKLARQKGKVAAAQDAAEKAVLAARQEEARLVALHKEILAVRKKHREAAAVCAEQWLASQQSDAWEAFGFVAPIEATQRNLHLISNMVEIFNELKHHQQEQMSAQQDTVQVYRS